MGDAEVGAEYEYTIDNSNAMEHVATVRLRGVAAVGGTFSYTPGGGVNAEGLIGDLGKLVGKLDMGYTHAGEEGVEGVDMEHTFTFRLKSKEDV